MSLESTATDVRRGVTRLGQRLRATRPQGSLSSNKIAVLGHLHRRGESSPGQIARASHQQPQSLTRVFAELELAGLVARRPNPADGREVLLRLTATGEEALLADMRARDRWLVGALADLDETELGVLRLAARILDKVAEAAEPDATATAGRASA